MLRTRALSNYKLPGQNRPVLVVPRGICELGGPEIFKIPRKVVCKVAFQKVTLQALSTDGGSDKSVTFVSLMGAPIRNLLFLGAIARYRN